MLVIVNGGATIEWGVTYISLCREFVGLLLTVPPAAEYGTVT